MAKCLMLCFKDCRDVSGYVKVLYDLSRRLAPDNIDWPEPEVFVDFGKMAAVMNVNATVGRKHDSVCLGHMVCPDAQWWRPGSEVPDGSYALFRSDSDTVELVSDIVASRTIWYVYRDDLFIASTSQRAIVALLGDFQLNSAAVPWMLSCGCLGPGYSWDHRIKSLGPDSRLVLDRSTWKLSIKRKRAVFVQRCNSEADCESVYRAALNDLFDTLDVDPSQWSLMLSGGIDSRSILAMLKNGSKLKAVTWGLKDQIQDCHNDAAVAAQVAASLGIDHQYFETDISPEPIDIVFNRFLSTGEGRIDHVAGYMDGLNIWKRLHEEGVAGVIRGDQGSIESYFDCWLCIGGRFLDGYSNLNDRYRFGMGEVVTQQWPAYLERRKKESLAAWRDRLHHEFRIPYVMAALTEIKASYVEVMNPFLCRCVIEPLRGFPDRLRSDKRLFKKIVKPMLGEIETAKSYGNASLSTILSAGRVVDELSAELESEYCRQLFSDEFVDQTLKGLKSSNGTPPARPLRNFVRKAKKHFPMGLKHALKKTCVKLEMNPHLLGFRVYMISKMNRMLSEDAQAFCTARPILSKTEDSVL